MAGRDGPAGGHPTPVVIPEGLSDEAAAALLECLYALAAAIEANYAGQLHRHYHERPTDERQLDLWERPPF